MCIYTTSPLGGAADVTATKGYLQRGRRRRSPSCDSLSTWGVGGRRVRDFSDWTGQRVGGRSHSNIFTDRNTTEVTFCIYTQHKLFFSLLKKRSKNELFFFRVVIPVIGSDWQQITWSDFTDKNKQVVEEGEEEAGRFPFGSVVAASLSFPFLFLNFLEHVKKKKNHIQDTEFRTDSGNFCCLMRCFNILRLLDGKWEADIQGHREGSGNFFSFFFFLGYAVFKKTFWHFGTFSVLVEPKDPSFKDSSEALDHWQAAGPWAWARASGGLANVYVKKYTHTRKKNKNKILLKEK